MPTVPTSFVPQVSPQGGGLPGFNAPSFDSQQAPIKGSIQVSDAQPADYGKVMMQGGAAITDWARRMQDRDDETAVKQLESEYLSRVNGVLSGEGGYMYKRGQDAVDGYSQSLSMLNKFTEEIRSKAKSEQQIAMLERVIPRHYEAASSRMMGHRETQANDLAVNTSKGRIGTLFQESVARRDPSVLNSAISESNTLHRLQGMPETVAKAAEMELRSNYFVEVVQGLIRDNPSQAQSLLNTEEAIANIPPSKLARLREKADEERINKASEEFFDNISNGYGAVSNTAAGGYKAPKWAMGRVSQPMNPNGGHEGVDYPMPVGTKLESPASGEVVKSGYDSRSGNKVWIKANDGNTFIFYHLDDRFVQVGDKVSIGQVFGTSGDTGRSSGGHVHHEIMDRNGNKLDPMAVYGQPTTIQPSSSFADKLAQAESIQDQKVRANVLNRLYTDENRRRAVDNQADEAVMESVYAEFLNTKDPERAKALLMRSGASPKAKLHGSDVMDRLSRSAKEAVESDKKQRIGTVMNDVYMGKTAPEAGIEEILKLGGDYADVEGLRRLVGGGGRFVTSEAYSSQQDGTPKETKSTFAEVVASYYNYVARTGDIEGASASSSKIKLTPDERRTIDSSLTEALKARNTFIQNGYNNQYKKAQDEVYMAVNSGASDSAVFDIVKGYATSVGGNYRELLQFSKTLTDNRHEEANKAFTSSFKHAKLYRPWAFTPEAVNSFPNVQFVDQTTYTEYVKETEEAQRFFDANGFFDGQKQNIPSSSDIERIVRDHFGQGFDDKKVKKVVEYVEIGLTQSMTDMARRNKGVLPDKAEMLSYVKTLVESRIPVTSFGMFHSEATSLDVAKERGDVEIELDAGTYQRDYAKKGVPQLSIFEGSKATARYKMTAKELKDSPAFSELQLLSYRINGKGITDARLALAGVILIQSGDSYARRGELYQLINSISTNRGK